MQIENEQGSDQEDEYIIILAHQISISLNFF